MGGYFRKATMVEGIGDELIYAFIVLLALIVPLVMYLIRLSQRQGLLRIHPDSAASVTATREVIGHDHPQQQLPRRNANDGSATCPICLNNAEYGVETNCGHCFCGICIVTYWQHGSRWLGAIACPVCRQQVTLLLVNFTPEENNNETEEKRNVSTRVNEYNRRFSGAPRPLMDYIRDLPTLLRHTYNEFFTVGGLIWMFRLRVIVCFLAALLYFISPLDIIPEAVFGVLGFLDDFFIILLLAIYVTLIYRQFVQNRAAGVH
ncbi:E3 ubiquitin-protein ligase RNF170-like [Mytilus trossulus]|uniref:E3 ubiquitin-protein ligase RNF170-like n=1 Tax=Mytilus trossulus TaxID=6551 RepID=UPI003007583D